MLRCSNVTFGLVLLTAIGPAARANLIYDFSGTISYSNITGIIPVGTPFSGTFSYDPSVLPDFSNAHYSSYATGTISLALLDGCTVTDSQSRVANHTTNGLPDGTVYPNANFFQLAATEACNTGSLSSLGSAITGVLFLYTNTFSSFALPTPLPPGPSAAEFVLGSMVNSDAVDGAITSWQQETPEPPSAVPMGALLAVAAVRRVWRRK